MTIGTRIKTTRLAWGWTQAQMAKALRCPTGMIGSWEQDRPAISGLSIVAMCALMGATYEALTTGEGFGTPRPQPLPIFRDAVLVHPA